MLIFITSDFHPNSELYINNYIEILAVWLESICMVLHMLERIPNFTGQLT